MKKLLLTALALGISTALLSAQTPSQSETSGPATTKSGSSKTNAKKKSHRKKGNGKTAGTHENHKN
jgi:hypothetical protein